MSWFQWERQLFCYNWLFYKCFSFPFCRNVLTRSGYWLLITRLNCLYRTTHFGIITWAGSLECVNCERELHLTHPAAAAGLCNNCKYHILSITVYDCKYTEKLCKSLQCKVCGASSSQPDYLSARVRPRRQKWSIIRKKCKRREQQPWGQERRRGAVVL